MSDITVPCKRCGKQVPIEGCDGEAKTIKERRDGVVIREVVERWHCPIRQAWQRDEDTWGNLEGPITDADEERMRDERSR